MAQTFLFLTFKLFTFNLSFQGCPAGNLTGIKEGIKIEGTRAPQKVKDTVTFLGTPVADIYLAEEGIF